MLEFGEGLESQAQLVLGSLYHSATYTVQRSLQVGTVAAQHLFLEGNLYSARNLCESVPEDIHPCKTRTTTPSVETLHTPALGTWESLVVGRMTPKVFHKGGALQAQGCHQPGCEVLISNMEIGCFKAAASSSPLGLVFEDAN